MGTRKPDTWDRSRLAILNRVIAFGTAKRYGDMRPSSCEGFVDDYPRAGDLVRTESTGPSKWYLSWVAEVHDPRHGTYLLQSIDDHSLCRWSNIGLSAYDRKVVEDHPEWKWSDKQWKLWDWWKNPDPTNEPYIVLPMMPVFDGESVTIKCRIRFGMGLPTTPVTLPNWRKVRKKDLCEVYRAALVENSSRKVAAST